VKVRRVNSLLFVREVFKMINFTLPVAPRSKKNSGQIVMRGKYPVLIPSKAYLQFEKECLPYLYRVKQEVGVVNYPVNIQCIFYMDARRKVDLSNLLNAIDDAMVKSGLIIDYNRDIIAGHDCSRVFHDKINPRIELEIKELKNYVQWQDTKNTQQKLL
jgi:Holliday junction resolvase RusA-like endonuclease